MKEKKYLFVYSETAAKEHGFNMVTLDSGETFKVTLVVDIKIDLNDFYLFNDKKVVAMAYESQVLSNVAFKDFQKAQEKEILKRMEFPAIKEIIKTLSQNDLISQKKAKAKQLSDKIKSML